MKKLHHEDGLWKSKNDRYHLTTHRLREMHNGFLDGKIKSIPLEDITFCELRTLREPRLLLRALQYFLIINGVVYLLNNYLFNAELIKLFFEDIHIGPNTAAFIFYISLVISLIYIVLFIFSVNKVFSFYSSSGAIDIQLRRLSFEERESFISKVEDAKNERQRYLHGH